MCGRFTQKSDPSVLALDVATLIEPLTDLVGPRFNGAPGQEHWVIRRHPQTGERHLDRLRWGLIPHWIKDASPRQRPINAAAERVANAPMFRAAYARRRCLVPVDSFFEWASVAKGPGPRKAPRQPYVVAMRSGRPFALAGVWESRHRPGTEEIVRTFAVITTPANAMIEAIHDRMPLILEPSSFDRWLSPIEPDPHDLMVPHALEPMTMWPVSPAVNTPDHDDASILLPTDPPPGPMPQLDP